MNSLNNNLGFHLIPMQQSELHSQEIYQDLNGYSIYCQMQNQEEIYSESLTNQEQYVESQNHMIPDLNTENSWTSAYDHSNLDKKPSCAYAAGRSPSSQSNFILDNLSREAYELKDEDIPPAEYFIPQISFDDISSCEESANTSSGVSSDDSAIWSDLTASLNLDASQSFTCDSDIKRTVSSQNLSEDYMHITPAKVTDECKVNVKGKVTETSPNVVKVTKASPNEVKVTEGSSNEHKPPEPYLNMIAKAIMSTSDQTMMLNDIYNHIYEKYPFFKNTKCAWRSSVRYNLSVNECFVKCSRGKNGRGFYWGIHPACLEDFQKGNYNRRQARHRVQSDTKKLEASIKQAQITHSNLSPIASALREVQNIHSPTGATVHYRSQKHVRAHPYATNTPLKITHQLSQSSYGADSSYMHSTLDMAGSPNSSYSGSPMHFTSTPHAPRDQMSFLFMNQ